MPENNREPNQKNSPLPDDLAARMEEEAKEVVEGKFGSRFAEVKQSSLSGGTEEYFSVTVRADSFIMNVNEEVVTELGVARIGTVYPTGKESECASVSVEFMKEEVKENSEWEANHL